MSTDADTITDEQIAAIAGERTRIAPPIPTGSG